MRLWYNAKPMRVLHIAWEYPPHIIGGLGRHVVDLTQALVGVGVDPSVITPLMRGGAPDEHVAPGITVRRAIPPMMEEFEFFSFVQQTAVHLERAALTLASETGPFDLIHAHDWLGATAGIGLKHRWRVPLIATIHATERGRGRGTLHGHNAQQINDLEWHLTYEAWRVIVCSAFMVGQLQDYFQLPDDKIDLVPNGVEVRPDPFADATERQAFRRRYVADYQCLVFYVGRIVYEKGLHVLLDAWPQITAFSDSQLVIAGIGGQLDALKQQVRERGLSDSIHFAGFISDEDREKLYRVADVAVFPSLYEPFGIVALEAFASGCPVVVSDTGGLAEVVDHGTTGLVVPPADPASLAQAVLATLNRPTAARIRAQAARRLVEERYSWQEIAVQTTQVYKHVQQAWNRGFWGHEHPPISKNSNP
jgi:glycogen synthase